MLDQGFIVLSLCLGFSLDRKRRAGHGHNRQRDSGYWKAEGQKTHRKIVDYVILMLHRNDVFLFPRSAEML